MNRLRSGSTRAPTALCLFVLGALACQETSLVGGPDGGGDTNRGTGGSATGTGGAGSGGAGGTGGGAGGSGGASGSGGAGGSATDAAVTTDAVVAMDAAPDQTPVDTGGPTTFMFQVGGLLPPNASANGGRYPVFPAQSSGKTAQAQGSDAVSPAFSWTGAPAGTMSFAITLRDLTSGFHHWVIWDIPATTTAIPEDIMKVTMPPVPAGSTQRSIAGIPPGYIGPFRPAYADFEMTLWALKVAKLGIMNPLSTPVASFHDGVLPAQLVSPTAKVTVTATGRLGGN